MADAETKAELRRVFQGAYINPRVERATNELIDALGLSVAEVTTLITTVGLTEAQLIGTVRTFISEQGFSGGPVVQDAVDLTKEIDFDASGITTGNRRTITMDDADVDLADLNVIKLAYIGQNLQTGTTYELVLSDAGKMLDFTNGSAIAVTIPANSAVAFPVNTRIDLNQGGAGLVTVDITTDTLNGDAVSQGQWKGMSLWKRSATVWVIYGGTTA